MLDACLPLILFSYVLDMDLCVAVYATKWQSAYHVERQLKQNSIQGVIPDAFTA